MRAAIVTGAGSGIGAAIAMRLAADGYAVAAVDLDRASAEAVVATITAAGGTASAYQCDVSDAGSVAAMAGAARAELGAPELVVNNAGHADQAAFMQITPSAFDRMFAVHVRGTFLVTQAFLPAMLERQRGVVINMASQLGQIGGVELVHYAGAKGAIIAMTKSLAREVAAKGVRVNAIAPGPINTPLVAALSEDWKIAKAAGLPLGRFGEPLEIAGVVSFLASDDAALFAGQTLGPNSGDVML
ncbi:SDR family NAD(P)-dependent oxidoreductase [Devosia sp.]|uniref:SDR family NAD(P)-dependent oxidoreductase n=1 Tax=Devosia sp. TaxID=1871048 RepID=UPI0027359861|nr:SDR family NAD(P)-dependent oxidoreductase [Devosia sp.]MDP2780355.1 SDR family NAD(P)-dependent oxidoreductase [Devosia sp.]